MVGIKGLFLGSKELSVVITDAATDPTPTTARGIGTYGNTIFEITIILVLCSPDLLTRKIKLYSRNLQLCAIPNMKRNRPGQIRFESIEQFDLDTCRGISG